MRICLNGTNMTVGTGSTCTGKYSGAIPANGVIYVENGSAAPASYSPFTATYPTTSGCGNVYVRGTYTGQLTIAAENDIIIDGDICRGSCGTPTGTGMLGLIANNFVRVYHKYEITEYDDDEDDDNVHGDCGDDGERDATSTISTSTPRSSRSSTPSSSTTTTAAATTRRPQRRRRDRPEVPRPGRHRPGGTGYIKNYVYDDRLRYQEPPYFIEPTGTAWVIGRQTEG